MDCELGPAAPPQALLGSLWHVTGMPDMSCERSWFSSVAAFVPFYASLWLLLAVFVYCRTRIVAKPQVGVSAGAEPSPGQQGGGSSGAWSSPRGGLEGPCLAGEAVSQPGPGGSGQAQVRPWRALCFCWCHGGCWGRSPLTRCFLCLCRKGDQRSTGAEATSVMAEVSSPWARAGALQRHPWPHVPTALSGDAPSTHSVSSACSLCPPGYFTVLEDTVSGAVPPGAR